MKNKIIEALKELGVKEVILATDENEEATIEFAGKFDGVDEAFVMTERDFSKEGL